MADVSGLKCRELAAWLVKQPEVQEALPMMNREHTPDEAGTALRTAIRSLRSRITAGTRMDLDNGGTQFDPGALYTGPARPKISGRVTDRTIPGAVNSNNTVTAYANTDQLTQEEADLLWAATAEAGLSMSASPLLVLFRDVLLQHTGLPYGPWCWDL